MLNKNRRAIMTALVGCTACAMLSATAYAQSETTVEPTETQALESGFDPSDGPTQLRDQAGKEAAPMKVEDPASDAIGISGGVDFVTTYWFRGIAQENQGLIAQPYLQLSFEVNKNISLYVGTWNSLQRNTQDTWYESDTSVGASFTLPADFGLDVAYINLYSPAGGSIFAEEFDITLSYDDSKFWGEDGDFALSPYVKYAIEVDGGPMASMSQAIWASTSSWASRRRSPSPTQAITRSPCQCP